MLITLATIAAILTVLLVGFLAGWVVSGWAWFVADDAYWTPERDALATLQHIHDPDVPRDERRRAWRNLWRG